MIPPFPATTDLVRRTLTGCVGVQPITGIGVCDACDVSAGRRAKLDRQGRAQGQGPIGSVEARDATRAGIDVRRAAVGIAPLPTCEKTENEFYVRARSLGLR